jgi:hypothetical protein
MHEPFVHEAIRHEIGDRDECQLMLCRKDLQLGTPHGATVIVQDLADDTRRFETAKPAEVDRRFRVSDAL